MRRVDLVAGSFVFSVVLFAASTLMSAQVSQTASESRDDAFRARVALGRSLFESTLLSSNGKVSCATCHDAKKSFTDGLPNSIGVPGVEVGRNSPTLLGIAHVREFRPPAPSLTKELRATKLRAGISASNESPVLPFDAHVFLANTKTTTPDALTLEERCLGPIENPLEMASTIEGALTRIAKDDTLRDKFATVFRGEETPVNRKNLGRALADFLRMLKPDPTTPYLRYLDGESDALSDHERAGLDIFRRRGQCSACHSGAALSDGLIHTTMGAKSARLIKTRKIASRRVGEALEKLMNRDDDDDVAPSQRDIHQRLGQLMPILGGGYGDVEPNAQTLPLWDVAQTGPWFRDGSVKSLTRAVRMHVKELRSVPKVADVAPPEQRRQGAASSSPDDAAERRNPDVVASEMGRRRGTATR